MPRIVIHNYLTADGGPGSGPTEKSGQFRNASHQNRWLHGVEGEAEKSEREASQKKRLKERKRGSLRRLYGLEK
jgi:hypothetical protein